MLAATSTYPPHPGLIASLVLEKLSDNCPESLDLCGCGVDAWGMSEENQPSNANRTHVAHDLQVENIKNMQDGEATIDVMPSFVMMGARFDYACALALKTNPEIRSENALADTLQCGQTTLRSMRAESYKSPRSESGVDVVRRLALLSGISYKWIRFGGEKEPVVLSEAEASELRRALKMEGGLVRGESVAEATHQYATNAVLFDAVALAKLWGMIQMHPRAQSSGWNADDGFNCLLYLYPLSNCGRADAQEITRLINEWTGASR